MTKKTIRHKTKVISIGRVRIGGNFPVAVQSMTKTDTRDIEKTIAQIKELEKAGCEIIRSAIPGEEAADAIKIIKKSINLPFVADIHFDYRLAIKAIENGADKIRINPGNIGEERKVKAVIDAARAAKIPIRIGVNAGSMEKVTERTKHEAGPATAKKMVKKALEFTRFFEKNRFTDIVLSLKASDVMTTVAAYREAAKTFDYPLHLGVTEAGTMMTGAIKSGIGLGILLSEGIGDTLRVSLASTPLQEVKAGFDILRSLNLRNKGADLIVCPTCGRCGVDLFELAGKVEAEALKIKKPVKLAVMGCAVNGPGEAAHADLGIACGKGMGLFFKNGKIIKSVKEDRLFSEFMKQLRKL